MRVVRQQAVDLRVRIVQVAEGARPHRTRHHAGRGHVRIQPGHQPACQAAIDALVAEGAFLHHPTRPAFYLRRAPFWHRRVVSAELLPVERPGAVRAGHFTVAAADAALVIHHHNPIRAFIGGFDRTYPDARGIVAMLARPRQIDQLAFDDLSRNHPGPLNLGRHIVMRLAGQRAVPAAGAFGLIDHHRPTVLALAGRTGGAAGLTGAAGNYQSGPRRRQPRSSESRSAQAGSFRRHSSRRPFFPNRNLRKESFGRRATPRPSATRPKNMANCSELAPRGRWVTPTVVAEATARSGFSMVAEVPLCIGISFGRLAGVQLFQVAGGAGFQLDHESVVRAWRFRSQSAPPAAPGGRPHR